MTVWRRILVIASMRVKSELYFQTKSIPFPARPGCSSVAPLFSAPRPLGLEGHGDLPLSPSHCSPRHLQGLRSPSAPSPLHASTSAPGALTHWGPAAGSSPAPQKCAGQHPVARAVLLGQTDQRRTRKDRHHSTGRQHRHYVSESRAALKVLMKAQTGEACRDDPTVSPCWLSTSLVPAPQ